MVEMSFQHSALPRARRGSVRHDGTGQIESSSPRLIVVAR